MAASVVYSTFGGRVIAENRGGFIRQYVPDNLGSTVALIDATGAVTDTYDYWPYGEERIHIGASATPMTFLGTLGYFGDFLNMLYVRARHLRVDLTRWMTVDRLWPHQRAFCYCGDSPSFRTDETGDGLDIGGLGSVFFKCVIGGGFAGLIDLLNGSVGSAACKAAGGCIGAILSAVLQAVLTVVCPECTGVVAGCLGGLIGGLTNWIATMLCDHFIPKPCPYPAPPPWWCGLVGVGVATLAGCGIGKWGEDSALADDIIAFMASISGGRIGAASKGACEDVTTSGSLGSGQQMMATSG